MKVPGEVVGQMITILLAAQMRGWIDLRGIEPLLKIVVESGNAGPLKAMLGEIIELLDRVEKGQTVR